MSDSSPYLMSEILKLVTRDPKQKENLLLMLKRVVDLLVAMETSPSSKGFYDLFMSVRVMVGVVWLGVGWG